MQSEQAPHPATSTSHPATSTRRPATTAPPIGVRELTRRRRLLRTSIGRQVRDLRTDANLPQASVAAAAGIDQAHVSRIEAGTRQPSLEVLVAIAAALGADVGVRLFPGLGPRIRDRFQAPMVEALLRCLDKRWIAQPEVAITSPARGVIDLVISAQDRPIDIACEAQSELRRLEEVLRRATEKAAGLAERLGPERSTSRLLLLRSTAATREIARRFESTLAAAYPGRTADAYAALSRSGAAWPGSSIVWVRLDGGQAEILDRPPRGIRVGR